MADKVKLEDLQIDPKNYPPGQLPLVSLETLRAITERADPTQEDADTVMWELGRAREKLGHFGNLNAEIEEAERMARTRSATATFQIATSFTATLAKLGAAVKTGSHRGGRKSGAIRRLTKSDTSTKIEAAWDQLARAGVLEHNRSSVIANRLLLSEQRVRKIVINLGLRTPDKKSES